MRRAESLTGSRTPKIKNYSIDVEPDSESMQVSTGKEFSCSVIREMYMRALFFMNVDNFVFANFHTNAGKSKGRERRRPLCYTGMVKPFARGEPN